MNLTLNEEQELIRTSVNDYFTRAYPFDVFYARLSDGDSFSPETWKQMAELGWIGLGVPAERGGLGMGTQEHSLLMEGAGAALALEPLVPTAVMCAPLLAMARQTEQTDEVLASIIAGDRTAALAWCESGYGFEPLQISTRIEATAGGLTMTGRKAMVEHGGQADWLLVSGRQDDDVVLLCLPADTAGVTRTSVRMADGTYSADIEFNRVLVPEGAVLARGKEAESLLIQALHRGLAAACAQAVGAMRQAMAICRDYLHDRVQFGAPLASKQVLQHRFSEMTMAFERAVSMSVLAAIRADEPADSPDAVRDLYMAKHVVGQSARFVGGQAIQLHGGMGMTLEYPIGHYYRKLLCCDAAFGTCEEHLSKLASSLD